jgi:hypothetical protein
LFNDWGPSAPIIERHIRTQRVRYAQECSTEVSSVKVFSWCAPGSDSMALCTRGTIPSAVQAGGVAAISAGSKHSLALKAGRAYCWGIKGESECSVPLPAADGAVTSIRASLGTNFAFKKDGSTVVMWKVLGAGDAGRPFTLKQPTGIAAVAEVWQSTHAAAVCCCCC